MPLNRARVVSKAAIRSDSVRYQPIAYRLMGTGGGEGGPGLAALDLLIDVLVDIFAEIYDHKDGDDRAEALLHGFKNSFCFHDVVVLKC